MRNSQDKENIMNIYSAFNFFISSNFSLLRTEHGELNDCFIYILSNRINCFLEKYCEQLHNW